jgi:hypothetical protein
MRVIREDRAAKGTPEADKLIEMVSMLTDCDVNYRFAVTIMDHGDSITVGVYETE